MNRWTLIRRSLRHYWRTHLGVVLGTAVGAAVLVGALLVGDSVRYTLRQQALARIGDVRLALASNDRLFDDSLAERLLPEVGDAATIAPILLVTGVASTSDQSRRVSSVFVHGVDERFFAFAPSEVRRPGPQPAVVTVLPAPEPDAVYLNERLAAQLDASVGDSILVRVERPSALPRDMVLAPTEDAALALRVKVTRILSDDLFGRFSLQANQIPPASVFFSLAWLQTQLELDGRANLLLVGGANADEVTVNAATSALRRTWEPRDAELAFTDVAAIDQVAVTSARIFIDAPAADALAAPVPVTGVLTYFVNALRCGERSTPYSTVAGVGALGPSALGPGSLESGATGLAASWRAVVPPDLADQEIVISEWLASDLDASVGDEISIDYFILGAQRRFEERTSTFRVRAITPIAGVAADRTLMPDFPGIVDAEDSRDWDPGIPIDLDLIREKDETYWDEHRGTPKAFVTLAAAQSMWGNRFGSLTALRAEREREAELTGAFRRNLDPAAVGLFFEDVRTRALAAGVSATDFGGLFLGLSFFLIVAALLLTALLFVFGVEQRSAEIGTLLAVGFRPRVVRRLLLAEAGVLAVIGGTIGAGAGVAYTQLVLAGLATVWRDAVAFAALEFHVGPATMVGGGAGAVVAALGSMWLALRRQVRRPAVRLLAGTGGIDDEAGAAGAGVVRRWASTVVAAVSALAALGIIVASFATPGRTAAGAFFGAGALLLVGSLAAAHVLFSAKPGGGAGIRLTIATLGIRNCRRRRGRSLATVALLAFGCFLVVSVGANRLDALRDADARTSGTGGFAFIGQSAIGVVQDLNDTTGRDAFGLGAAEMKDVSVVAMRVRDGDDASCLNLNVAQKPRLVGVRPDDFARRGAFTFAAVIDGAGGVNPWSLLSRIDPEDRVYPAIGDAASVTWALHKKIGDTLDYLDERGQPFRVRIVGTVANSILQGNLLIARGDFQMLYPSESGDRMFLIDAPAGRRTAVSAALGRGLSDVGLELTRAPTRLAEFNAVQNTYLVIFQMLGGLGLLLGSAGLGTVVLRNVLERRRELALLGAVGWRPRSIRRLVMSEHTVLLLLGLLCGTVSALIAVVPSLASPGTDLPIVSTGVLLVAVTASGAAWVWLATRFALRGALLRSLQDE